MRPRLRQALVGVTVGLALAVALWIPMNAPPSPGVRASDAEAPEYVAPAPAASEAEVAARTEWARRLIAATRFVAQLKHGMSIGADASRDDHKSGVVSESLQANDQEVAVAIRTIKALVDAMDDGVAADLAVPVFVRHMSLETLRSSAEFFESPAGQATVMPASDVMSYQHTAAVDAFFLTDAGKAYQAAIMNSRLVPEVIAAWMVKWQDAMFVQK